MSETLLDVLRAMRSASTQCYRFAERIENALISDGEQREARDRAAHGGGEVATFAEWLATEMPAGTVIGDPAWWADRIARQYAKRARPAAEAVGVPDGITYCAASDNFYCAGRGMGESFWRQWHSRRFEFPAAPSQPEGDTARQGAGEVA